MAQGGGFDVMSFLRTVSSRPEATNTQTPTEVATPDTSVKQDVTHAMVPPAVAAAEPQQARGAVDQRILGAAHSNAANAFASAAASGGGTPTSGLIPRGRRLPLQHHIVCNVMENADPEEDQPQLEVSPITMYNSEYIEEQRRQVAVNDSYICYSLRNGNVRILNKLSASRALHKGHTQAVTDLCCFSDTVSLLASAAKDDCVFVYRVGDSTEVEGEIAIFPVASFQVAKVGGETGGIITTSWHTVLEDILAFAADNSVYICNLSGKPGEDIPVSATQVPDCVARLDIDSMVTKACFSPKGDMLAAGSESGKVYLWKLNSAASPSDVLSGLKGASATSVITPYGDGLPTRVSWIPLLPEVGGSQVFLTGGPVERDLKLWSIGGDGETQALQQLTLEGPEGEASFYNHMLIKPELQLIILANTKANAVYTIHYALQADSSLPIRLSYLARFSVTMPILSMMATWNSPIADGAAETIQLYCVQTQAVQQYTLHPAMCCPPEATGASVTEAKLSSLRHLNPDLVGEVDASDLASSVGFATAGSVGDPADLPEPSEADVCESVQEEEDEVDEPKPEVIAAAAAAAEAAARKTEAVAEPVTLKSPKLLTPTELLATVRRSQAPVGNASAAEAEEPPIPLPLSPLGGREGQQILPNPLDEADVPPAVLVSSPVSPPPHPPIPRMTEAQNPAFVPSDINSEQLEALTAQMKALTSGLSGLEASLGSRMDAGMLQVEQKVQAAVTAKLDDVATRQQLALQQHHTSLSVASQKQAEELLTIMSGFLNRDLPVQLAGVLRKETESIVGQLSQSLTVSITSSVSAALGERLPNSVGAQAAAIETAVIEQLSPAIQSSLRESLHGCFQSSLLPGFDRAVQQMFSQLDSTVTAGLQQHAQSASEQAAMTVLDSLGPTKALIETVRSDIAQYKQQLEHTVACAMTNAAPQLGSAPMPLAPKGAVSLAELEAAQDPTIQLRNLVNSGDYEQAYTQALSMSHVDTVVWLCAQVDRSRALSVDSHGKPLLSQGVLLSLVQQLGSDLVKPERRTMKLAWVQDVCLALNPQDPVFAPHMRGILSELNDDLHAMTVVAAGTPDVGQGRLVSHVVKSLLSSCQ